MEVGSQPILDTPERPTRRALLQAGFIVVALFSTTACTESTPPGETTSQEHEEETSPDPEPTPTPEPDEGDSSETAADSVDGNCLADANWFPHSSTPRPSDGSFESISNCVFHKWSWQMFLWLTQEHNGRPRFLSLQSPESLLGMSRGALFPRKSKRATPQSLDEFLQAGTDGILVDHSGRGLYYSQHINSTFADFITDKRLTDPAHVRSMPPETEFPIVDDKGALELKASWMIVSEGDDVSDMFTMETEVAKLVNRNGKIVIDPLQTEVAQVALVGFHIGGVVKDHPEMIWATFEHKRNAPNVPSGATAETIVAEGSSIFYTGGTQYKDCNVNPALSRLLELDEASQALIPITQVCRQFEFGNDPDSTDESVKTNDGNIAQLNGSVHAALAGVWKNYFEVGAIWFLDGKDLRPGLRLADDKLLTGSLRLSNSTIETFTQTQSVMNNCFRCHNTQQEFPSSPQRDPLPPTNLNISHAFQNIYFWSQEDSR